MYREGDGRRIDELEEELPPVISLEAVSRIEVTEDQTILFHGTHQRFRKFTTPTGKREMDVTTGGVVYFYEDPIRAAQYNSPEYVCVARVTDAVDYAQQRSAQGLQRKKGAYTRGVWVALPANTEIVGFIPASELC